MSTVPHTVLPVLPATGLLRERVAGRPLAWSRDMALVGGLTSGFAPFAAGSLAPSGYAPTALVLWLVTGALLGLCMPALLEQVRGRVPLAGLLLLSPVAGFAWGALAGGLAGLPFGSSSAILGFFCGGATGAVQLGWFWFPYTFQSVRRGRTWPVVASTLLSLPVATLVGVMTGLAFAS